jgi:hypothetical protein
MHKAHKTDVEICKTSKINYKKYTNAVVFIVHYTQSNDVICMRLYLGAKETLRSCLYRGLETDVSRAPWYFNSVSYV